MPAGPLIFDFCLVWIRLLGLMAHNCVLRLSLHLVGELAAKTGMPLATWYVEL